MAGESSGECEGEGRPRRPCGAQGGGSGLDDALVACLLDGGRMGRARTTATHKRGHCGRVMGLGGHSLRARGAGGDTSVSSSSGRTQVVRALTIQ